MPRLRAASGVMRCAWSTPLILATVLGACGPAGAAENGWTYQTRTLAGWTVRIDERLQRDQGEKTERALELLQTQLEEVLRVVPAPAVERLKTVTLWFSPEYPGVRPTAEYHPDAGWLRANRRNPAMERGVEFTNIGSFEAEAERMPMLALHELAHAYHHQVLGYDQAEIVAAWERARNGGTYDAVRRHDGRVERAYALANDKEYFAEASEAFFGRNDWFPFTRSELKQHDPTIEALLIRLWGVAPASP